MSIKEAVNNFRQRFQQFCEKIDRKRLIKNMTPKILEEMLDDLTYDVGIVLSIKDDVQREVSKKEVLLSVDDLDSIIDEVLANVNKKIEELASSDSGLTQEISNSDLRNLQRGKDILYQRKNDVEKLRAKITGEPAKEIVDESEIRFE